MQIIGCKLLDMALGSGETKNDVIAETTKDSRETNSTPAPVDSAVDRDVFRETPPPRAKTKVGAEENTQASPAAGKCSPKPRFGKNDDIPATLADINRILAHVLPEEAIQPHRVKLVG